MAARVFTRYAMTDRKMIKKETEAYVRETFSSIASNYDLLNTLLSFNRDKYWRNFAVSKTGLGYGEKALDVATGTGELALELAEKVGREGMVTGIDFCQKMLSNAQDKLGKARCQNVELIQTSALALPFPDSAFDCATISFGLRNVVDIKQTLREMTRVLKVGGRLVCLEFSQPNHRIFRWIYHLYNSSILPFVGWLISRNRDAYTYLPRSIEEFLSPLQLKQTMEKVGLRNIEVYPLTLGIVTVHIGTKKGV